MKADEEERAVDCLLGYLATRDEKVRVLGRPDREIRDRRAVDFELETQAGIIGLEVTSASAYTADFIEVDRLEAAVEERLQPVVEAHSFGTLALHFSYQERPKKRDVDSLATDVAQRVTELLLSDPGDMFALEDPPDPIADLTVTRVSRERNIVGRISAPIPAYWTAEEVDAFVAKLLSDKATQAEGYEMAWILVISRTGLFSASDLVAGFARRRDALPANWKRVYFIEDSRVTEVLS